MTDAERRMADFFDTVEYVGEVRPWRELEELAGGEDEPDDPDPVPSRAMRQDLGGTVEDAAEHVLVEALHAQGQRAATLPLTPGRPVADIITTDALIDAQTSHTMGGDTTRPAHITPKQWARVNRDKREVAVQRTYALLARINRVRARKGKPALVAKSVYGVGNAQTRQMDFYEVNGYHTDRRDNGIYMGTYHFHSATTEAYLLWSWEAEEHPRDEEGQFTETTGAGGGDSPRDTTSGVVHPTPPKTTATRGPTSSKSATIPTPRTPAAPGTPYVPPNPLVKAQMTRAVNMLRAPEAVAVRAGYAASGYKGPIEAYLAEQIAANQYGQANDPRITTKLSPATLKLVQRDPEVQRYIAGIAAQQRQNDAAKTRQASAPKAQVAHGGGGGGGGKAASKPPATVAPRVDPKANDRDRAQADKRQADDAKKAAAQAVKDQAAIEKAAAAEQKAAEKAAKATAAAEKKAADDAARAAAAAEKAAATAAVKAAKEATAAAKAAERDAAKAKADAERAAKQEAAEAAQALRDTERAEEAARRTIEQAASDVKAASRRVATNRSPYESGTTGVRVNRIIETLPTEELAGLSTGFEAAKAQGYPGNINDYFVGVAAYQSQQPEGTAGWLSPETMVAVKAATELWSRVQEVAQQQMAVGVHA